MSCGFLGFTADLNFWNRAEASEQELKTSELCQFDDLLEEIKIDFFQITKFGSTSSQFDNKLNIDSDTLPSNIKRKSNKNVARRDKNQKKLFSKEK